MNIATKRSKPHQSHTVPEQKKGNRHEMKKTRSQGQKDVYSFFFHFKIRCTRCGVCVFFIFRFDICFYFGLTKKRWDTSLRSLIFYQFSGAEVFRSFKHDMLYDVTYIVYV